MQQDDIRDRIFASTINKDDIGKNVSLVGWLEDFRDMGKIGFITIRDMTGNFQGVVVGEMISEFREVQRQSIILVKGTIQETRAENFKVEVMIEKIKIYLH